VARVKAVVLAAGRGVRMGGTQPKTLIPVAEHPMLHYILEGLKIAGVDDLLVVTGFEGGQIEEFVTEHWSAQVAFVFNARWASWGNFHSVRMALDQSPGFDVLCVNSDVVVHPDVYKKTLAVQAPLVLAVQRRPNLDQEDMRVELDGDRIRQISKHVKPARSHGEFGGVSLVRPEAARLYLDTSTDWEWRGEPTGYYEDVYATMLDRVDTRAAFIRIDEYAEVDVPEDLPDAAALIARSPDAWKAPQPA